MTAKELSAISGILAHRAYGALAMLAALGLATRAGTTDRHSSNKKGLGGSGSKKYVVDFERIKRLVESKKCFDSVMTVADIAETFALDRTLAYGAIDLLEWLGLARSDRPGATSQFIVYVQLERIKNFVNHSKDYMG